MAIVIVSRKSEWLLRLVVGRVSGYLDMEWKESVLPQFEETFYVFRNLVGNIAENHKGSH